MAKLDEKLERGILREKNLDKWNHGDSPKEVFEVMEKSWKVDVPLPQIKVVVKASEGLSDYENGRIELSPVYVQDLWNSYSKVGRVISADDLLKSVIAQGFSLYALRKSNTGVFDCDFDIDKPGEQTMEDFREFVSVYAQISSVGEIGSRIMERHLGIYDIQKTKAAFELEYRDFEEKDRRASESAELAGLAKTMLASVPKPSKDLVEATKWLDEENATYLKKGLQLALNGAALIYVADAVENAYRGRLPQLMVENFRTNNNYVEHFNNFVKSYIPTFGMNLERALSRLKTTPKKA